MNKEQIAQARTFWCSIYKTVLEASLNDDYLTQEGKKMVHDLACDAADRAIENFKTYCTNENEESED